MCAFGRSAGIAHLEAGAGANYSPIVVIVNEADLAVVLIAPMCERHTPRDWMRRVVF